MSKPHSFRFGIVTTPPLDQDSYSNATERKVDIFVSDEISHAAHRIKADPRSE